MDILARSAARLGVLAVALGIALLAWAPGWADAGHAPGKTLIVTPRAVGLDLSAPERAPIAWELVNAAGHAMTVHGLSTPRAERLTLMRRRSLLGVESYQPVDFLRLEAGETVRLESPDYVLAFEGVTETDATLVLITLDLGPDGELTMALIEGGGVPTFAPAAER